MDMSSRSPLETAHPPVLKALRAPAVSRWTIRDGEDLLGCGALLEFETCCRRALRFAGRKLEQSPLST